MEESVKSEMKSWTDVVKKNTSQAQRIRKPLTENCIHREIGEQRSKNLMIYGYKEGEREVEREIIEKMKDVIELTGVIPAHKSHKKK